MGRTVVAEETVEDYVSSLYGVRKWQIGLVVGQVSRLVYNTIKSAVMIHCLNFDILELSFFTGVQFTIHPQLLSRQFR